MRDTLIKFMDSLRDYVRESHCNIAQDERESSEFVDIFLNEKGGMEQGPVLPMVSQSGEAGSKGGPQNAELKVFLLRKMEEYNYTFRNTDDEDRRYKAFISYKALEKFLKDAKKANFIK